MNIRRAMKRWAAIENSTLTMNVVIRKNGDMADIRITDKNRHNRFKMWMTCPVIYAPMYIAILKNHAQLLSTLNDDNWHGYVEYLYGDSTIQKVK